jgi:hypothetical protein
VVTETQQLAEKCHCKPIHQVAKKLNYQRDQNLRYKQLLAPHRVVKHRKCTIALARVSRLTLHPSKQIQAMRI